MKTTNPKFDESTHQYAFTCQICGKESAGTPNIETLKRVLRETGWELWRRIIKGKKKDYAGDYVVTCPKCRAKRS